MSQSRETGVLGGSAASGGFLRGLLERNIPAGLPLDELRCRMAFNVALLFHVVLTLPFIPLFVYFGVPRLALLTTPLVASYATAEVLMRHGYSRSARHLLLLAVTASIFVFCLLLGKGSGLEGTLYYCIASPFVVFSARTPRQLALAVTYPIVAFFLLFLGAYRWVTPFELAPAHAEAFYVAITGTAVSLVLFPLFFLLRHQVTTEVELQRTLRRAESSDQAKSQFLALVSHELRTPLNGVFGGVELALDDSSSAEQSESLKIALSSAQVLRNIIADILEFSQIDKGGVSLSPQPIFLADECRLLLAPAREQCLKKGIQFSFSDEGAQDELVLDGKRVGQVLLHLVENAIKFTDDGEVKVLLSQYKPEKGQVYVELIVEDTGAGMTESQRDGALAPFAQLHREKLLNAQGTGLGLTLAERIVRALDGNLEIVSVPGKGTKVLVRLFAPVYVRPSVAIRKAELPAKSAARDILVVEDEPVNRAVTTKILERAGWVVTVAVDGEEAVRLWSKHHFSHVLMDCQMPIVDGYEATRQIRDLEKKDDLERTLIVAYSANALSSDRERCQATGMDRFLAKPASKEELLNAVSSRLSFD